MIKRELKRLGQNDTSISTTRNQTGVDTGASHRASKLSITDDFIKGKSLRFNKTLNQWQNQDREAVMQLGGKENPLSLVLTINGLDSFVKLCELKGNPILVRSAPDTVGTELSNPMIPVSDTTKAQVQDAIRSGKDQMPFKLKIYKVSAKQW